MPGSITHQALVEKNIPLLCVARVWNHRCHYRSVWVPLLYTALFLATLFVYTATCVCSNSHVCTQPRVHNSAVCYQRVLVGVHSFHSGTPC